ncbi:hypothetical protein LCGC14_2254440, partial [marine sediment metagenome]
MLGFDNPYKELLVLSCMENKTITYKQYNNQINKYNQARARGFKIIIKKNMLKVGLGLACLGIALFPNGLGFVFYPLSFYFLGLSLMDLENIKRKIKNKIRGFRFR